MTEWDNIVFALINSKEKGRCDFVETWNIVFENKILINFCWEALENIYKNIK